MEILEFAYIYNVHYYDTLNKKKLQTYLKSHKTIPTYLKQHLHEAYEL